MMFPSVTLRALRVSVVYLLLAIGAGPSLAVAKPIEVRLLKTSDGYQLQRGGQPYMVRGVGGTGDRELLKRVGGNSIRTWGAEGLDQTLADAERLGLTVAVGIGLGHERHGFNYNDADQVARQLDATREIVERYKSHPAVLLWGIGNEMEGYEQGQNAAIWSAINNLASMVKQLDPLHPTMTVVAEIGGDRVKNIHRLCPEIDIVGINSYGGVATLPQRYRDAGGTKPYIVTEFGPPGMWEVKKTPWGAAPELTSTAKAESYRRGYEGSVLKSAGLALGSYAFLWGQKQEATATWFGMLLPDGNRLAAIDTMQELWTGTRPANYCPRIDSLEFKLPESADVGQLEPGSVIRATLKTTDAESDPLRVEWVLQGEPSNYSTGGDAEESPPKYPDAIVQHDATSVEVKLPAGGGGYRLFAYVRDDQGGAAVANLPLFIKGPIEMPRAKIAELPLVLYGDPQSSSRPYIPAGYMGKHQGLRVKEDSTDSPHTGETCLRVEYREPGDWAGVVWQSPAQDWGDRPGGYDLSNAKKLSLWARGATGGEIVSFEYGVIGKGKKFADTGKGKLDKVKLTSDWQRYTIDLAGQDLSRIKTGFVFVLAGQGHPVVFYLDDIRFE